MTKPPPIQLEVYPYEAPARRSEQLDDELEVLTRITDTLFRIPGLGWRFGLDPIVGFIPGVGDLATTLISAYILLAATRYGVPKITLVRMGLNVVIDLLVGVIPFAGDLFDAWWKTNVRNTDLMRQRVEESGRRGADLTDWLFVALVIGGVFAVLFFVFWLIASGVGAIVGALRG